MFSPPPGDLKPAYLATRKLDESLLSDSRMADGVEVTGAPPCSFGRGPLGPHVQFSQRTVHGFSFLSTLSMVNLCSLGTAARFYPTLRSGDQREAFFLCIATAPWTQLIPKGTAVTMRPACLLECACEEFQGLGRESRFRGSQVWVINFQCCCLTINEVMALGQDWLYLSAVSHRPTGCSPAVRALHQ